MEYLQLFENFNNRQEYGGYKVGDRIEENTPLQMNVLPDSQSPPEDGVYELRYIPIDKTDIVIKEQDKRSEFDHDDYDDYQSNTFKYMTEHFDELPPIIFKEEKNGIYSHVDGHHRIIIAKELGRDEILSWIYTLDQSKDDVVNKPEPKFKTVGEKDSFLFRSPDVWPDSKCVFFYKDERLSGRNEFIRKWHQTSNKEDLKIMDRKFLPYLRTN